MSTLRKGKCYRTVKRAYTRKSKYTKKAYIRAIPTSKIVRYVMGDQKKKFKYSIKLLTKNAIQFRHNGLESARLVVNRHLELDLGNNYFLRLNIYPHHILRENKMLSGAHADRLQTGMSHSFGRPNGLAAQTRKGATILTIGVDESGIEAAKNAIKKARPKLPGTFDIIVEENKNEN